MVLGTLGYLSSFPGTHFVLFPGAGFYCYNSSRERNDVRVVHVTAPLECVWRGAGEGDRHRYIVAEGENKCSE